MNGKSACSKNGRQSNIELLRVIAMLLIVAGHYVGQSKIMNAFTPWSFNQCFALFIGSAARIAVNVFIIISAWFLVDSKFSSKKVIGV